MPPYSSSNEPAISPASANTFSACATSGIISTLPSTNRGSFSSAFRLCGAKWSVAICSASSSDGVEGLAGVLGEPRALGQRLDVEPLVQQEVQVAAGQDQRRGAHDRTMHGPSATGGTREGRRPRRQSTARAPPRREREGALGWCRTRCRSAPGAAPPTAVPSRLVPSGRRHRRRRGRCRPPARRRPPPSVTGRVARAGELAGARLLRLDARLVAQRQLRQEQHDEEADRHDRGRHEEDQVDRVGEPDLERRRECGGQLLDEATCPDEVAARPAGLDRSAAPRPTCGGGGRRRS